MTSVVETLWARLETILASFAARLVVTDQTLRQSLGRTANRDFLLRGYLTFSRHTMGDEVAITIDVQGDGSQIAIVSDICTGEGMIVAPGPSATISFSGGHADVDLVVDRWLGEFQVFLLRSERTVAMEVSKLS